MAVSKFTGIVNINKDRKTKKVTRKNKDIKEVLGRDYLIFFKLVRTVYRN
jgi:hypothetical protein